MQWKPSTKEKTNKIALSDTLPWPHQFLVCMRLSESAYYLKCIYDTMYVYNDEFSYGPLYIYIYHSQLLIHAICFREEQFYSF